jgi:hypothetical protein
MPEFSKDNQPATRGEGEAIAKSNKKRAVMTDALMKALNRTVDDILDEDGKPTKKLSLIADKLVNKAYQDGDTQAIKEIFDRTEGKAAQAINLGGGDSPVDLKWTVEFVNASKDAE